jgi:hypothetical protein
MAPEVTPVIRSLEDAGVEVGVVVGVATITEPAATVELLVREQVNDVLPAESQPAKAVKVFVTVPEAEYTLKV